MSVLSTFAAAVIAVTPAPASSADLGAPGTDDQAVAVQAAFAAAEQLQGPLDGLWRIEDADGRTLFVFDLIDPGGPPAPLSADPDHPGLEGAWRDPNRPRGPDSSGVIDAVSRDGPHLSIHFVQGADQATRAIVLTQDASGGWSGELADGGARRQVVMRRL